MKNNGKIMSKESRIMNKDIIKILFAIMITVVFCGFQQVLAVGEDFSLEISPENPGPNATVSAKIISYSFDIDRAEISWLVNGVVKLKGTGEKKFSFTVGNAGSKISLTAVAATKEGLTLEKSVIFRPAGLDILWEANNYVPAGYKGKALPSSESTVKIAAFPEFVYNGEKLSPSSLYYDWQINSKNKPNLSGYGKRSFNYKLSDLSAEDEIMAIVSSYSGIIIAEKRIKIKTIAPKIIFYKEHPMEGVLYNSAFGKEISLTENEISLRAEPYFFSKQNLNNLTYQWKMNGKVITPEQRKTVIDFRLEGASSGNASVNLEIQNPVNLLQNAANSLRINFGIQ